MITRTINDSLERVERRRTVRAIKMGEGAWHEFLRDVERDPSASRSFSSERRTYRGYAIELDLAASDAVIIAVEEDSEPTAATPAERPGAGRPRAGDR